MHLNVLNKEQSQQLLILKSFKREFVLVGGTAIALHIGHRKSIDFDLFKFLELKNLNIKKRLSDKKIKYQILFENNEGIHFLINGVKWTFFHYPFSIQPYCKSFTYFKIPDLLTLAAMKAYALGRRSKWKDYVDLCLILENHYTFKQISIRADELFAGAFSEKMFRVQLTYFKDIDYSEQIDWIIKPVSDKDIQKRLIEISVSS